MLSWIVCVSDLTISFFCSSVGQEPLFYVQPDEELDVSVDEICTDPESRTSAHSDASLASGLISSLSSHGSPEAANSSSPKIDVVDEDENFNETLFPEQADMPGKADGSVDEKIASLSVQDEQEGKRKPVPWTCPSRILHYVGDDAIVCEFLISSNVQSHIIPWEIS